MSDKVQVDKALLDKIRMHYEEVRVWLQDEDEYYGVYTEPINALCRDLEELLSRPS